MNEHPVVDRLSCGDHLLISYWTEPKEYRLGLVVECSRTMAGQRFDFSLHLWTWTLCGCFMPSYKQHKDGR